MMRSSTAGPAALAALSAVLGLWDEEDRSGPCSVRGGHRDRGRPRSRGRRPGAAHPDGAGPRFQVHDGAQLRSCGGSCWAWSSTVSPSRAARPR
ncbi:hypothetical protein QJS66_03630 [Kocuria rhizophila]|nr:hypothetical protein QJS66_03630 [Kocuria rhizophila]